MADPCQQPADGLTDDLQPVVSKKGDWFQPVGRQMDGRLLTVDRQTVDRSLRDGYCYCLYRFLYCYLFLRCLFLRPE